MIYFDHAATSINKPKSVIEAVTLAMSKMGNSGRAAHGFALDTSRTIYDAREKTAKLFGCKKSQNVIFTSNSTESLNIAIFGSFVPGDHIISTVLEHNSVLRPLYELKNRGVRVDFVPADSMGRIELNDIENLVCPETAAIICTHASNLTGNLLDISAIGDIAKRHNLLFIVDASQTAGRFNIDMEKMNIGILCFTGHKSMLGPQGTGGMCIKEGVEVRPLKMGGTGVKTYLATQPDQYPTRLEAGTLNAHGIAGLLAAIDFINQYGMEKLLDEELSLMQFFYEEVIKIPGIKVYGDFSKKRAPIVALNFEDMPSSELSDYLWDEYEIATRSGAHCAPKMHEALGTVEQGAVRFSFGYENTKREVEVALCALGKL